MEKFLLNGKWRIKSNSYDTVGDVPGSVYSALLKNGLMEDPFYRDNERKALAIMDEEFVFTKEFSYVKSSKKILLVCEGIDTLCDLYINGQFVAHTDNMHRAYVFDVTQYLVDGDNVILKDIMGDERVVEGRILMVDLANSIVKLCCE